MNDTTRSQGAALCVAAAIAALLFLVGVLRGSYLALAIPVAVATLFALGLVFWVGYTIYSVRVEPEADEPEPRATVPPSPPPKSSS